MPHKDPVKRKQYKDAYTLKTKQEKKKYDVIYNKENANKKRAAAKKWNEDNPGEVDKRLKKWLNENPEKRRAIQLRHEHGIEIDDYNKMFSDQKGCCKICGTHQNDLKKRLFIDHCHSKKKVRGLLCQHCNSLLGFAKDDVEILQNAINYLTS